MSPVLCRFSDAGDDDRLCTLKRPAFEKRRGRSALCLAFGGGHEAARLYHPWWFRRRLAARCSGAGAGPEYIALAACFTGPRTSPVYAALFNGLRQYGFVEGQNLFADPNGYGLRPEQLATHASEIVDQRVDVIVCAGDHAIRAAQQATRIIPILGSTEDMLGSGLVHSMARPEGNTTGSSILSTELNGKRQEILMELLPTVRHMAALADANASTPQHLQMLQELCPRGVELSVYWVSEPEEIAGAIEKASPSGAGGVNVLASPFLF